MCTAISYNDYFGRNLDLDSTYNEQVTIVPRKYKLTYRKQALDNNHYAFIGMAAYYDDYPLFFDGMNEYGLCCAALNFPDFAYYKDFNSELHNITPFEFIPWILSQCQNLTDAKKLISKTNLVDIKFNNQLPLTPLHFIIADKNSSISVEPTKDGIKIYDNPYGVLTNSPPFDMQMFNLNNYLNLTANTPNNRFSKATDLNPYSFGMGAIGLPGDFSSSSRFVKATFVKTNSPDFDTEKECINQVFRILNTVAIPKGSVIMQNGNLEYTIYSCCMNDGKYYYTSYNGGFYYADIFKENLDTDRLIFHKRKVD